MRRVLIFAALSLALSACTIHRVDVQQGNIIDAAQIEKLKVGMEKSQVRYVLGTPLLNDPFHENRWDYVYSRQRETGPREVSHISIIFEGDVVARIERREPVIK